MSLWKLLPAILAMVLVTGCQQQKQFVNDRRTKVLATTQMAADLVTQLTDPTEFQVISLMGSGVDPHLYKPTAGDIQRISNADLIVYGGLHLEGRMSEAFHQLETKSFSIGDHVPKDQLLMTEENSADPHIWLDLHLWSQAVEPLSKRLIQLRPSQSRSISQKKVDYTEKLQIADQEALKTIQSIPENSRILITAHDAFQYFGMRYGIEVLGIQGTNTAAEASPKRIQELAKTIVDRKVKAIFVESSVSPTLIRALQEAVISRGWKIEIGAELYADSPGPQGTQSATTIGMFQHNVNAIHKALK